MGRIQCEFDVDLNNDRICVDDWRETLINYFKWMDEGSTVTLHEGGLTSTSTENNELRLFSSLVSYLIRSGRLREDLSIDWRHVVEIKALGGRNELTVDEVIVARLQHWSSHH